MKSALFAGLAVVALSMPVLADTPAAPSPAARPTASRTISFAQVKAEADAAWNRFDVNHDGRIDKADREARLLEHFAKWDANHDGMISKDEFLDAIHAHEGEGRWHHPEPDGAAPPPPPPPGPPDGPHGDHGRHPGGMVAMAIVGPAMHGLHKDGALTRAAFDAAVKAEFDKIDANHDGTLSHDELRAAWHGEGDHRHGPQRDGPWRHGETPPPPPAAGQ